MKTGKGCSGRGARPLRGRLGLRGTRLGSLGLGLGLWGLGCLLRLRLVAAKHVWGQPGQQPLRHVLRPHKVDRVRPAAVRPLRVLGGEDDAGSVSDDLDGLAWLLQVGASSQVEALRLPFRVGERGEERPRARGTPVLQAGGKRTLRLDLRDPSVSSLRVSRMVQARRDLLPGAEGLLPQRPHLSGTHLDGLVQHAQHGLLERQAVPLVELVVLLLAPLGRRVHPDIDVAHIAAKHRVDGLFQLPRSALILGDHHGLQLGFARRPT